MSGSNSTSGGRGKALRFGALVRVSTEKQEQQGESLRTQRKQNQRDVELLGGHVGEWYGGAEHATEGWERKEIKRLADSGPLSTEQLDDILRGFVVA